MEWCQKIISWIYKPKYEKMRNNIMDAEIVSFDIYDTVIRRNVMSPMDIFELVEIEFKKLTGRQIENYREIRYQSECIARSKSDIEEIQMEQIFESMEGISLKDKRILKDLEIQYELKMSFPNKPIIELYKYAIQNNKRIIFTSDMYLAKKELTAILDKNGIKDYEKLYISSEYGKSKHKGSLYQCIIEDLQIEPKKILHIGDSLQSDIMQARRSGIKTCLVPRYRQNLKYWKKERIINQKNKIQYSVLKALMHNIAVDDYNDEFGAAKKIGFEVLGPILAGYSMWLNRTINNNKVDKIFFLSREGKILQQAYNILYKKNTISQSYLYVSRRSVIVPLLYSAHNFDELLNIIKILMKTPELKSIRNICLLNEVEYRDKLKAIGLAEEDSIYDIRDKKRFFDVIHDMVYEESKRQKKYFIKYLRQMSFSGNVLIADSGWSGTIQQVIQEVLSKDSQLHIKGVYIGVRNVRTENEYKHLDREGFLFEPSRNQDFDYMTRFTNEILEKMLSGQDGSTIKYEDKGEIIPILAERQFHDKGILFVQQMQKEALRFVGRFEEFLELFEELDMEPGVFFNGYINFAVYPTRKNVKIFSEFNSKYELLQPMVPDKNIIYYLFHMKELKHDLSTYCSIFLLKKIFVLPLPYYEILSYLIDKIGIKSDYRKKCEDISVDKGD